MDYRYLYAFYQVARLQSMSAAAETMKIAQSAVSRQITLLEESLQTDLFLRGARGVRLTPKGKQLFEKVSSFQDWIKGEFFDHSLPVRIGGLEGALNWWLGPKLIAADTTNTMLPAQLSLHEMGNEEVRLALEDGSIDIGLSSDFIESEWISSRKLYTEKIYLISKNKISIEKLTSYPWIGVHKTNYLHRLAKNKPSQRVIQAGSVELLLNLVKAGHGIAAITEQLIPPSKDFIKTPTSITGEAIYLHLPSYRQLPASLKLFIQQFLSGDKNRSSL